MWIYQDKAIQDLQDIPDYSKAVGFTYKITCILTGKFYIGKKSLISTRRTKIGKREKAATKTRKTFKQVVKESDWLDYWGSSEELLNDIEAHGKENFIREILEICYSKKYLGYCELKHQILHDVLSNKSYNGNILGRFYKQDMPA